MTQKTLKKKASGHKGKKLPFHRGKPTASYLEDQKRIEDFKKTINGWKGDK